MNKKIALVAIFVGLALAITPILAQPNVRQVAHVSLPANAVEVAPNVFDIGQSVDVDGAILQGYAIIHPKAKAAKPANPGSGKGGNDTCYAFLAKGAKWKAVEPYLFNAGNTAGLSSTSTMAILADSLTKWDNAAGVEVFGSQVDGPVDVGNIGVVSNGANEVAFGSIDSAGDIAVTYVWGIFGGPVQGRELREWDMVYDQEDFTWGLNGELTAMDFENIATHEIGHAAGMGHPGDTCVDETMYRFANEGETKKRSLNAGDIAGIQALY